ncbi:unnamed protein product [Phytophthora fragariaefolia]|uniref:Unnamed protein product n=1 Tax=Phytophthora fragariaefolia TaxID=1490495 RepID=A0A9W7DAA6_9STRA|nr:unnamed protein product [Phytophthora fragariaefolia]
MQWYSPQRAPPVKPIKMNDNEIPDDEYDTDDIKDTNKKPGDQDDEEDDSDANLGGFASIQSLQSQTTPRTIPELIQEVENAFNKTSADTLNKTFLTLQHVMEHIMNSNGGNDYRLGHLHKNKLMRTDSLPTSLPCDARSLTNASASMLSIAASGDLVATKAKSSAPQATIPEAQQLLQLQEQLMMQAQQQMTWNQMEFAAAGQRLTSTAVALHRQYTGVQQPNSTAGA